MVCKMAHWQIRRVSPAKGCVNLTATPQNGFKSAVSLACTGLPVGETRSFSPATVKPSGAAACTQLILSAERAIFGFKTDYRPILRGTGLTLAVWLFRFKRWRVARLWRLPIVAGIGMGLLFGCGGSGSWSKTPVTSMVTVTAKSGSPTQTVTISLTVD